MPPTDRSIIVESRDYAQSQFTNSINVIIMTRNFLGNSPIAGPVLQFSLLIVPLVVNCFYMVYSLTGWVLEGRDKLNWAIEAPTVGLWVLVLVMVFSGLVLAYTRWRGGSWWHPLSVSSIGHMVLALLLTASILISVKL